MTEAQRGSAAAAAQEFFNSALNEAKALKGTYESSAKRRRWLAIILKGIALFGGLAVATLNVYHVVLGVIISVAVLIDQLFSNYGRMMTETIATDAVARTLRRVEGNYNHEVLDVIGANEKGDSERARALLMDLARKSAKVVRDELDRIRTAVEDANIQFLSNLNLDQAAPANTPLPKAPAPELPKAPTTELPKAPSPDPSEKKD